jgi:repressor LexA
MEMKDRIKFLRQKYNLTLEDVGNRVGVGKSTVRKWENGDIANMRRDKIAKLAEALHTTPGYLMGWDDESFLPDNIIPMPRMNQIPLVGEIACGTPIMAEQNISEYIDLPEHVHADFALRCKGDSMKGARILDGDVVYIRQQPQVDNGEIAAVLIDDEATLKRIYVSPDSIILQPENPEYAPLSYVGDKMAEVHIIGKAVAFTSAIK